MVFSSYRIKKKSYLCDDIGLSISLFAAQIVSGKKKIQL